MASLLLALLAATPACAAVQTSGTFNILSFNVAGLPAIFNSNGVPGDKTTNTASIGQKFSEYNYSLINVQEDFNYHAALYSKNQHPYRTATSGGVPFGSGLNTLSNFYWVDFERIKWNKCSDASGNDCLTPKGFTFMRVQVSEGVWIDAYNLHADAGTEPADLTARADNLKQVSDYITTYSTGNPVLVFGDTNSRYTRSADIPRIFTTANGMKDPWVELVHGGVPPSVQLLCDNPSPNNTCEIVDKAWYRGSAAVTLNATSFNYAGTKFLQPDGNVLSDHDPVLVDFKWSLGSRLRLSEPFGGPHGNWYNDLDVLASIPSPAVASITLAGANRLDSVSIRLTSGQVFTHGGTGGTASTLTLNPGERLVGATLCSGQRNGWTRVFYAQVTTSSGRNVVAGTRTSDCVTRSVESGWGIVGFVGRSDDEVDRLGFVYSKA